MGVVAVLASFLAGLAGFGLASERCPGDAVDLSYPGARFGLCDVLLQDE
jgi:hypothetical protein